MGFINTNSRLLINTPQILLIYQPLAETDSKEVYNISDITRSAKIIVLGFSVITERKQPYRGKEIQVGKIARKFEASENSQVDEKSEK